MLIASLDLILLHGGRINSVDDEDEMIPILLVADDIKVSSKFVTVQVAANSDKLSLARIIRALQ